MNFKELVKSNRTCRRYDGTKSITRQDLLDLVDLVRYTPVSYTHLDVYKRQH